MQSIGAYPLQFQAADDFLDGIIFQETALKWKTSQMGVHLKILAAKNLVLCQIQRRLNSTFRPLSGSPVILNFDFLKEENVYEAAFKCI